jgi:hypothetical protein
MKNALQVKLYSIFTVAVLFIFSNQVTAQKRAEFGIRYMPTISDFKMQNSSGNTVSGEATIGYGVGAFVAFNFSQHIGIQAECIYSSVSQKLNDEAGDQKVNLKYFNIPVLFSLNTGKDKTINLNASAGPQLGINVGSSLTTSNSNDQSAAVLSVKNSDIGFAYGAGVDFGINKAKTARFGIGFRNVIGLVDISDQSNNSSTDSYYVIDKTNMKTYSAYAGISIQF